MFVAELFAMWLKTLSTSGSLFFFRMLPGYLVSNKCKVSSANGKILLIMLFVNNLSVSLKVSFCITCLNFKEIFWKFIGVLVDGSLSCIPLLSPNYSLIVPSSHNFNRLSNAIRWPHAFDFLLGFCRSKAGITCITLSSILFRDMELVQWSKSRNFINKLLTRGASRYYKNIFMSVNYLFISFF